MAIKGLLKAAAAAGACLLSLACGAQTVTKITGTFDQTGPDNSVHGTFSCTPTSSTTCTGSYSLTIRDSGCTNSFVLAGTIDITGMDLSHPGPIQGQAIMSNGDFSDQLNPDGTCSIRPGTSRDVTLPYTGTCSGTVDPGTFTSPHGQLVPFNSTAAPPPPPSTLAVTASVDAVTAN